MNKILIIKVGATGDVVRTSVLLSLFPQAEITWVTAAQNKMVLPQHHPALQKIVSQEEARHLLQAESFDLIISLDDDLACAQLATDLAGNARIFGAYAEAGKVNYSADAREWFDMGLSSRLGKAKADALKWANQDSYQEILFRMLGHAFKGEEYLINEQITAQPQPKRIGIETRAGNRWPTKQWNGYPELAEALQKEGYNIFFFEERPDFLTYFRDISRVALMVTGDSLGMHIALALKIPTVAVFTCTSATEIWDYNRLEKVVSPLLETAFYTTDYRPDVLNAIPVEEMLEAVHKASRFPGAL